MDLSLFKSLAEKLNEKSFEIFEALDNDHSATAGYFKSKCNELPSTETLVNLRDKRPGNEGRSLLHNAARNGNLPAVLHLIRLGHPLEPFDSGVSKITPLMDAIMAKNVEIAIVLVESGAQLLTGDINDENALHFAARTGSTRMIKYLIKASGMSPDEIRGVASCTNIKLNFPEDLAKNSMAKEMLINFRESGTHASIIRALGSRKESRKGIKAT